MPDNNQSVRGIDSALVSNHHQVNQQDTEHNEKTNQSYASQSFPTFIPNPAVHNLQHDTMQYSHSLSSMQSPWMSGTEGSISPFLEGMIESNKLTKDEFLENYTPDMDGDLSNTMDLSWLTAPPSTYPATGLGITHLSNKLQSSINQSRSESKASNSIATISIEKNSISELLASRVAFDCQQLLEDPIRRKPGRKPKGLNSLPNSNGFPQQSVIDPMNLGTEFVGDKKEERKFKNREAADQSRKRLKDRSKALEEFTGVLTEENEALRKHLKTLEKK